jgi:hypothetical protein
MRVSETLLRLQDWRSLVRHRARFRLSSLTYFLDSLRSCRGRRRASCGGGAT